MDGAMGTELQRLTRSLSFPRFDHFNLARPDLVRAVHRAYREAGAGVLLTNTFQTTSHAPEIWTAALHLARAEAGAACHVLADIGPVEVMTPDSAACVLHACRCADGVLLETWSSLDTLHAFAAARAVDDPPLLVSFTYQRDNAGRELRTFLDVSPEECARAAVAAGAVALGANCGKEVGMADMLELVQRYRRVCALPLFVRPNAGTPVGTRYPRTRQEMADALPALLKEGVAMVGGCCGTTPAHIRACGEVMNTH
jgi:methionine synthase I (cobalamin-dependent)